MKANRRARKDRDPRTPDGGQMLLLAGFLIAGTALMAIGTYTVLQRTETQVQVQEHQSMLNLFLNTRSRAQAYFHIVTANDTAASVQFHLDGYLASQYQTANALSLRLNATLAGADTPSDLTEEDFTRDLDGDGIEEYADPDTGNLWATDGSECYSGIEEDGTDDGLIVEGGDVKGAIFWLEVQGTEAKLEEYVIIDVPSTEPATSC